MVRRRGETPILLSPRDLSSLERIVDVSPFLPSIMCAQSGRMRLIEHTRRRRAFVSLVGYCLAFPFFGCVTFAALFAPANAAIPIISPFTMSIGTANTIVLL